MANLCWTNRFKRQSKLNANYRIVPTFILLDYVGSQMKNEFKAWISWIIIWNARFNRNTLP